MPTYFILPPVPEKASKLPAVLSAGDCCAVSSAVVDLYLGSVLPATESMGSCADVQRLEHIWEVVGEVTLAPGLILCRLPSQNASQIASSGIGS